MPDGHGPYETEAQARAAALAEVPPDEGWSILRAGGNRELLARACEAAGVDLGAFDRRILDWLAGSGDSACAVIAGIVRRAAAREPGDEAAPGRSTTPRGFAVYDEFTDTYGNRVRVQKSSNATMDAVWIFANHPASHILRPDYRARLAAAGFASDMQLDELAAMLTPAPHLDVEQAKRVRDALGEFIGEHETREDEDRG